MFSGYLEISGMEVANSERFRAYVDSLTAGIGVKCGAPSLDVALGHSAYTTPAADGAPWYNSNRPDTGNFAGVLPLRITGLMDSTRAIDVTELLDGGGVQSIPREGTGEIRVQALLVAVDEAAMHEGLVWLKEAVGGDPCDDSTLSCVGHTLRAFTAQPTTTVQAADRARNFYRVEVLDGVKISKEYNSSSGVMIEVEWTWSLGVAGAHTDLESVASFDMSLGTSHADAVGEDCSVLATAYENFINDPYYTAITPPPRPDIIQPPNLLDISSWRRMQATIPMSLTSRSGIIVPTVKIFATGAEAQFIRVRFYKASVAGATGCDYDAEFFVSYVPAGSVIHMDTIRREISITKPDNTVVPAGHLVFGTDGRPYKWPELSCHESYVVVADMMPGQTGITVLVEAAVRE